ncbi:CoA-transferase [Bradyrhizobium sp. 31Argb]|uniref:CoA transferase subunit A n=1 Tax=unclassified Bradyrhizobium TaxID=2631580 RepID=UPI00102E2CB3|nr:CoA-transferase [Bradyrhizobium sp. Leo170]TAI65104.1 acyl CoA--acetate/3-ketoacid CoA transferase subunit alpha [Bradyrhizobium sp. Leo170]
MSKAPLASKLITLAEAAGRVPDGCRLALGGFAVYQKPMAFVRELIRQGRRDLTIIGSAHSFDVDMLAGAGCLKKVETSYVGLEKHGLARNYRRAVEGGRLKVVDYPEMACWDRFRANQDGFDFWPAKFLGGNDVVTYNDEIKEFPCPITGRRLHAFPAANPDVVVIHAIAADEQGNIVTPARRLLPQSGDVLMARSCEHVIVTAEKIVPKSFIKRHARFVELPSYRISAVVEVPWGAHPTPTLGRYLADDTHLDAYVAASASEGTFAGYLDDWVRRPADHFAYLDKLGAAQLSRLTDLGSLA